MAILADTAIAPELSVRRLIDGSVTRALSDREYKQRLLTDPTIALEGSGCPPQQFKTLRSIHAIDLDDFARQAYALFWRTASTLSCVEDELPLAAAAR